MGGPPWSNRRQPPSWRSMTRSRVPISSISAWNTLLTTPLRNDRTNRWSAFAIEHDRLLKAASCHLPTSTRPLGQTSKGTRPLGFCTSRPLTMLVANHNVLAVNPWSALALATRFVSAGHTLERAIGGMAMLGQLRL